MPFPIIFGIPFAAEAITAALGATSIAALWPQMREALQNIDFSTNPNPTTKNIVETPAELRRAPIKGTPFRKTQSTYEDRFDAIEDRAPITEQSTTTSSATSNPQNNKDNKDDKEPNKKVKGAKNFYNNWAKPFGGYKQGSWYGNIGRGVRDFTYLNYGVPTVGNTVTLVNTGRTPIKYPLTSYIPGLNTFDKEKSDTIVSGSATDLTFRPYRGITEDGGIVVDNYKEGEPYSVIYPEQLSRERFNRD